MSNLVKALAITVGPANEAKIGGAKATTANQALLIIRVLQKAQQEIKFIRSPHEGEIGVEMVRMLAEEEAQEFPTAPSA